MLQYATFNSKEISAAGQTETVLRGGCRWIRLTGSQYEADVKALMPICQDSDAILVIDDDVELVENLRVHGVHLTSCDRGRLIAVREKLGPHAIIGVTCCSAADIEQLCGLDVDYITVPYTGNETPGEFYQGISHSISEAGAEVHLVASGCFPADALKSLLKAGVAGVEMSKEIFDNSDPAAFVKSVLDILTR